MTSKSQATGTPFTVLRTRDLTCKGIYLNVLFHSLVQPHEAGRLGRNTNNINFSVSHGLPARERTFLIKIERCPRRHGGKLSRRYPIYGGGTRFLPRLRQWLYFLPSQPKPCFSLKLANYSNCKTMEAVQHRIFSHTKIIFRIPRARSLSWTPPFKFQVTNELTI